MVRVFYVESDSRIANYLSAVSFFIRSKLEPRLYWHENGSGKIVASSTKRSRFCIRQVKGTAGSIMIDKDTVFISPIRDPLKYVRSNQGDGGLRITTSGFSWLFESFKTRFVSYNPKAPTAGTSSIGKECQVHCVGENGEEWELV